MGWPFAISPARTIGLLYSLAILVMMIRAGTPEYLLWWLGALPFIIWCASPVLAGLRFARKLATGVGYAFYVLTVVAIGVVGFVDQWYVLFIGPSDAQNALVMVFTPLLQWVAVGGASVVALFLRKYVFKS